MSIFDHQLPRVTRKRRFSRMRIGSLAPRIPLIIADVNMNNFDHHWNENFSEEIALTKKIEAQRFLWPLFDYRKSRSPLLVLDAGCGDGVHVEVVTCNANELGESSFVGLDISMPALCASRRRGQNKWVFVQADVSRLPFGDEQFDVVYSFGVLAYTPYSGKIFAKCPFLAGLGLPTKRGSRRK